MSFRRIKIDLLQALWRRLGVSGDKDKSKWRRKAKESLWLVYGSEREGMLGGCGAEWMWSRKAGEARLNGANAGEINLVNGKQTAVYWIFGSDRSNQKVKSSRVIKVSHAGRPKSVHNHAGWRRCYFAEGNGRQVVFLLSFFPKSKLGNLFFRKFRPTMAIQRRKKFNTVKMNNLKVWGKVLFFSEEIQFDTSNQFPSENKKIKSKHFEEV